MDPDPLLLNDFIEAGGKFGFQFTDDEILCKKKPINFFISTPTMIRYLDPVFYAHNLGIDILLYSNLENGLHPFPGFLAEEVIQYWTTIFKEYIDF
jgi:adenosylhomocysteinase